MRALLATAARFVITALIGIHSNLRGGRTPISHYRDCIV